MVNTLKTYPIAELFAEELEERGKGSF